MAHFAYYVSAVDCAHCCNTVDWVTGSLEGPLVYKTWYYYYCGKKVEEEHRGETSS